MRFLKEPSLVLGIGASVGLYTYKSDKQAQAVDRVLNGEVKRYFEVNKQEESSFDPKGFGRTEYICTRMEKLKSLCKEKGVDLLCVAHLEEKSKSSCSCLDYKNNRSFIWVENAFEPKSWYQKYILNEEECSQELQEGILGHECAHILNQDTLHDDCKESLFPLVMAFGWRSSRYLGRRGELVSLACAVAICELYKFWLKTKKKEKEFRADSMASNKPEILEALADHLEKDHNKDSIHRDRVARNIYNSWFDELVSNRDEKNRQAIIDGIRVYVDATWSHPSSLERADRLRKQANHIRFNK